MYGTYDIPKPSQPLISTKHGVVAGIGIGILFCLIMNTYQHHWNTLPTLTLSAATDLGCFPLPTIDVPSCPSTIQADISQRLVDRSPFPQTHVDICYTDTSIELSFHAKEQINFMTNPEYGYNDNIWQYNVMETFISLGTQDPATYFEFEVSPTNQSYGAFVFNPHKDFSSPIGHFFVGANVDEARSFGISVSTQSNEETQMWSANASFPLTLFNVDIPQGTTWRMNFFRKITSPSIFPAQDCGAWNAPNQYNFHETPCFGLVRFV
ncbi:hypothetical protein THRCLA_08068 [Thraustotheca clavata]|uniref:Carbohydrate-binding domain-containing protein n=1 Tax=Thraustotheca clavata TaxID=74557 RepID=A0A1V9ZA69_9STRA|nr:hypothetical protein THRCLA_08068 [Thraustotheca clavata]